jgi:peptidoglycan LD-endopeptidase CwlK
MKDKISIARAELLHPYIKEKVITGITFLESQIPAMIRLVYTYRSFDLQNQLYAQGRTTPGKIVSNAKGGQSLHNYGLAFDYALMYDKDKNGTHETLSWDVLLDADKDKTADWTEVAKYFKELGFTWGGDFKKFKDSPHIEYNFGQKWSYFYDKHLKGHYKNGFLILP